MECQRIEHDIKLIYAGVLSGDMKENYKAIEFKSLGEVLFELKNIDIPATSIFNETGKQVDKQEFLDKFLSNFENEYNDFLINGIKGEVLC